MTYTYYGAAQLGCCATTTLEKSIALVLHRCPNWITG